MICLSMLWQLAGFRQHPHRALCAETGAFQRWVWMSTAARLPLMLWGNAEPVRKKRIHMHCLLMAASSLPTRSDSPHMEIYKHGLRLNQMRACSTQRSCVLRHAQPASVSLTVPGLQRQQAVVRQLIITYWGCAAFCAHKYHCSQQSSSVAVGETTC